MKKYIIIIQLGMLINMAVAQTLHNNKPGPMESILPNIFVRDIKATIQFYTDLGFKVVNAVPKRGDPIFVMMTCGTATFMFQTFKSIENTLPVVSRIDGGSLLLYIKVNDIRSLYNEFKRRVPVLHELAKTFYGTNEFSIKDNNNYMLTFAENE
jgi:catechol 2,3-dioxygenase-like lactoylglutathione lyase family enzyme